MSAQSSFSAYTVGCAVQWMDYRSQVEMMSSQISRHGLAADMSKAQGNFFEDFAVGQEILHATRVTEGDACIWR